MDKLEWLYYVRPENIPVDNVPWEGPEDTSFVEAVRNVTGIVEELHGGCLLWVRVHDRVDCYVIRLLGVSEDDRNLE